MQQIKLRMLQESDASGMLEWMKDPEIQNVFRNDMGKITMEEALEFIRSSRESWEKSGSLHLAVADEKDEYLGTISLKNIDLQAKNAEYAISLRRKAHGKGIGYTATRQLLEYAFSIMKLERIYLNVLSDNEKAIRLYERVGFVFEGEFRKHLYLRGAYRNLKWYGLLRENYINMGN